MWDADLWAWQAYRIWGGMTTVPQIGWLTPVVPIVGAKAQGANKPKVLRRARPPSTTEDWSSANWHKPSQMVSRDHELPYWEPVGVSPEALQTLRGETLQGSAPGPSIPLGKIARNNSMPRLVCRISSRTHNMVDCWQGREWGQMGIHADWLKQTSCPVMGNRVLGALYELPGDGARHGPPVEFCDFPINQPITLGKQG
ncbi:hypothetical protein BDZ97DRAFT_2022218 [Flammula alnicola]|nr:hypothetical protein BDZ97DRAFT_2022218 [Flammula alnicola]